MVTPEKKQPKSITLNDVEYFISNKIGEGAYGNVHECKAKKDHEYAVKCIPLASKGMPCLMEASIMSSVRHRHINSSTNVQLKNDTLYILQDKARCDFYSYSRQMKVSGLPDIFVLRRWAYDILQAIDCLHSQEIVHGDVKSANILLCENGMVKLADFTLSVKIDKSRYPKHPVCTVTHRPIEVLLGEEWSYPVDIWSYGCTLYEMAYGELLFGYQNEEPINKSYKAINCILEWRQETKTPIYRDEVEFKRVTYPNNYFHKSMILFNRLIHSILRINPNDRPNVKQLLDDPFFNSMEPFPYVYIYPKNKSLPTIEDEFVRGWLNERLSSKRVLEHVYMLYIRCQDLDMTSYVKLNACTSIACKIFHVPLLEEPVTENENRVCCHLNYRLHW